MSAATALYFGHVLVLAALLGAMAYLCYQRGRMTGFARGCRYEREARAHDVVRRSRVRAWWHGAN